MVEVDTACHFLTDFVSTIPMDCLRLTLVGGSHLVSDVDCPDDVIRPVIDGQGDESVFRQAIWNPPGLN